MIPKIIHYAWVGGGPLPDKDKRCLESWHKYCPEYEIKLWTEDNYDVTKCRYMHEAYQNGKWAFVSDYFRLDILYQYGGIYLDTDVEMLKSYDSLLHLPLFMGIENTRQGISVNLGLGFGAVPGHPVVKAMRDDYEHREFLRPDGGLNLTSCPIIQTEVLRRYGFTPVDEKQVFDDFVIFPSSYFCPLDGYTGEIDITPNTYSIHHFNASWMNAADRERRALRKQYYKRLGGMGSEIVSTLVAYTRHYGLSAGKEIVKKLQKK